MTKLLRITFIALLLSVVIPLPTARAVMDFQKLANPAVLPDGEVLETAWSPDGDRLATCGTGGSDDVKVYTKSGIDETATLTFESNLSMGSIVANGCSWNADSTYLAVAHAAVNTEGAGPRISVFFRSGSTYTKLANPATAPTGIAHGVGWSPDGNYLAVAHETSPFLSIYAIAGSGASATLTKIADPGTLPANNGRDAKYSPDGDYLAIANAGDPEVTVYTVVGETYTKIPDPDVEPPSATLGVSWHPSSEYLAFGHFTSPFLSVYYLDQSISSMTKISNPATLPTGTGRRTTWSPDGTVMGVAHATTPFASYYDFVEAQASSTLTKLANPTDLPTGTGNGLHWSPAGFFVAVGHATTPFLTAYYTSTGGEPPPPPIMFRKLADPTPAPDVLTFDVEFSPRDSGLLAASDTGTSPFLRLWRITGDDETATITRLSDPSVQPTNDAYNIGWDPSGSYLISTSLSPPFMQAYYRSGLTTLRSLPNPDVLPVAAQAAAAWSDGVVVAGQGSIIMRYYDLCGVGRNTKLLLHENPSTVPTSESLNAKWSPDETVLAVTQLNAPRLLLYSRDPETGDLTLISGQPATLPPSEPRYHGLAWSHDGNYLAVGTGTTSPGAYVYFRSGTTYTKLADIPAVAGEAFGIAWSPDDLHLAIGSADAPFIQIYNRTGSGAGATFTLVPNAINTPPTDGVRSVTWTTGFLAMAFDASPYMHVYAAEIGGNMAAAPPPPQGVLFGECGLIYGPAGKQAFADSLQVPTSALDMLLGVLTVLALAMIGFFFAAMIGAAGGMLAGTVIAFAVGFFPLWLLVFLMLAGTAILFFMRGNGE